MGQGRLDRMGLDNLFLSFYLWTAVTNYQSSAQLNRAGKGWDGPERAGQARPVLTILSWQPKVVERYFINW